MNNALLRLGTLLFIASLALTACDQSADDHGHLHNDKAGHQHDDHSHDAMPAAPKTEAFYADENNPLKLSSSVDSVEEADEHHHEHGEHGHNH